MLNIPSYLSSSTVTYIFTIYGGIWALGYGLGKAVAWTRFIKNVA